MANKELLLSFTEYCFKNPEQRFWQALRNWSEYNYILGAADIEDTLTFEDTFYKE